MNIEIQFVETRNLHLFRQYAIHGYENRQQGIKGGQMNPQIDYAKYENMTARQIFNSLESTKKKIEKAEQMKKENEALFAYLKSKLNEKVNEPKFVDFNKSASANTAKKILHSMSDEQRAAIHNQTLNYMNTADSDD